MPSYEILKAAVAFCFNWIIVNYWQFEESNMERFADVTNYANYPFIHDLLDCYKYLKIYAIWGNKNLKEIKDQREIYDQLSGLVYICIYFFKYIHKYACFSTICIKRIIFRIHTIETGTYCIFSDLSQI